MTLQTLYQTAYENLELILPTISNTQAIAAVNQVIAELKKDFHLYLLVLYLFILFCMNKFFNPIVIRIILKNKIICAKV